MTDHCCHNLSDAECAATDVRHCYGWVEDVKPPPDDFSDRISELREKVGKR